MTHVHHTIDYVELAVDDLAGARASSGLLSSHDLDATAAAVAEAGGTVTEGPYEFPGGRRSHFSDPARTTLGVWSTT